MSKKVTASKNNIAMRGKKAALRKIGDKTVSPVLYHGIKLGHGTYMAAQFEDGQLALDTSGRPIPYNSATQQ
ncbi:hypothetical protein [Candidatus Fokinia crypta]|uniref:50S ribosomal protein L32 n=1 Tax=Candidatus Fokinia crypta TaxID=1920990 RepID=A0ABZ0URF4_9RICK|nr:hypothetical protein [Candidatus Fokinia cryptica]WPX98147.1 hypothetical protein Fokcrypt_00686 [Candidatus Fokinia cryptica]